MNRFIFLMLYIFSFGAESQDLTSPYFQTVYFKRPRVKNISRIVYGNDEIGYFQTKKFSVGRKIKISDILPPTYKSKIDFYALSGQSEDRIFLGSRKFTNPTPKSFQSISPYYAAGQLTRNFIMVSASLPKTYLNNLDAAMVEPDRAKKNKNRFVFMMALNKYLEIIWLYLPLRGKDPFTSYVAFRKVDKDKYGFVLGKKDGYYASINSQGEILDLVDGTQGKNKFPMHHDFAFIDDDRLMTFGNRYAKLNDKQGKKKLFLTNTILTVDLKKNRVKKSFDFLKYFRPHSIRHWQENLIKPRWVVWDGENADHDFVHANSIEYYKGKGVLVSLKHLDKLVMIDEDLKSILWTIGPTKEDTYQATGLSRFSHQHDAQYIDDENILIFDNGFYGKKSRAVSYRLNHNTKRVEKNWEFSPKPKLYSANRSGVNALGDGLYLAHFVSPSGREMRDELTMDHDIIFIFDPLKKKILCELYIPFRTRSSGYRSFLFDTLGEEIFVGNTME